MVAVACCLPQDHLFSPTPDALKFSGSIFSSGLCTFSVMIWGRIENNLNTHSAQGRKSCRAAEKSGENSERASR